MATFEDLKFKCSDCGGEFVWSAGEQEFFFRKGFKPPKRCKPCRDQKHSDKTFTPLYGGR